MPRSTRTRRGVLESAMTASPQRLDRPPGVAAPCIQIGAPEEQLAADAGLLGRDRPFGGQATQAVPGDAEVFGGATTVQPFVGSLALRLCQEGCDAVSNELGELAEELIQHGAAAGGVGKR